MSHPSTHCYQDADGNELIIEERSPFLHKYTYSNKNPTESRFTAPKVLFLASKVISGLIIFTVVVIKYITSQETIVKWIKNWTGDAVCDTAKQWLSVIYRVADWKVAIIIVICACILLRRRYQSDSILVMRDLGIQLQSTGNFYCGGTTLFLSKGEILDILIQEAFSGFEVKFFLIVITNDRTFQLAFQSLVPRRDVVEKVWKSSRKCLYGSTVLGPEHLK